MVLHFQVQSAVSSGPLITTLLATRNGSSSDVNAILFSLKNEMAVLSELVIMPRWPDPPKENRRDGSYATSEHFEPHNKLPKAWRFHGHTASRPLP